MALDILIFLALAWRAYIGWKIGLLSVVVTVLQALIAFLISFKIIGLLYKVLGLYLYDFKPDVFPAIVFLSAVVATAVLMTYLVKFLKMEIEYDFPGQWDNIAGAIFSIVIGIFIISVFLWFIQSFGSVNPQIRASSRIAPYLENVSYTIIGVKDASDLNRVIKEFAQ